MKTTSALFTSFFATVLLAAGPASAAWFLKIEGIQGYSIDPNHRGWVDVQSFTLGAQTHQTIGTASGAGAAKVSTAPIQITKTFDKASPALLTAASSGKHFPTAVLEGTTAAGQVYMRIKLQNILVSSFQMGGSGQGGNGRLTDSMALSYQKIEVDYVDPKPAPTIVPAKPVVMAPKR